MNDAFLLRWIKLTFAGWALGFGLMLVLIAAVGVSGLGDAQFPVGLGMGLGVGFLQARVIKEFIHRSQPWVVASGVGMALPFVVFDVARVFRPEMQLSLPLNVVIGGLLVGTLQAWLLRYCARAPWTWILASGVGWTLAASTAAFNERFLPRIPGLIGALLYVGVILMGGVALGAVGGVTLDRVLKRGTFEPVRA